MEVSIYCPKMCHLTESSKSYPKNVQFKLKLQVITQRIFSYRLYIIAEVEKSVLLYRRNLDLFQKEILNV